MSSRTRTFVRRRFTYANVMSTIAVISVMGGTATAAIMITGANVRNESLTGADVRNGSLASADVRDRSLRAVDFAKGELPAADAGAQGPAGKDGANGKDGAAGKDGADGAKGDTGDAGPDLSGATHKHVAADGTPA